MSQREVRFPPGTVVSAGEYRNCDTGTVRWFDGNTPLPGGTNASSWQQVSDHFHATQSGADATARRMPEQGGRGVVFGPGTLVSSGEYRNSDTGAVRWFDGNTPLPGGTNAASWQQVSDHFHATQSGADATARRMPEQGGHGVLFRAGTLVSPGEYRNTVTGEVRWFDGNSPLPGGTNAASWQQVSDHFHVGEKH